MMRMTLALVATALSAPVSAQPPSPGAAMAGLSFLIGEWRDGQGQVAYTGGTAKGRSAITLEAGGKVLLRRDHTDLFSAAGKPTGSFEQVMMIYPEGGTLHADYSDGMHVIHYVDAQVVPGRSVTFTSAAQPTAPTFRLRYLLADPASLTVTFQMAAPGSTDFHPVATGSLTRAK